MKDRGMTYLKSSLLPRFLTERTTQLNIIEEHEDCTLYTKKNTCSTHSHYLDLSFHSPFPEFFWPDPELLP